MSAAQEALDLIEALRARGESFCIVTIVRTENSTSARAGAKAVVTRDGRMHGFVGGSCVTGAALRAAAESLRDERAQMIRVRPKDLVAGERDADGVALHGSSCPSGGSVDLFLEPMRGQRRLVICGTSPIARSVLAIARTLDYRVIVAAAAGSQDEMPGADGYLEGFDLASLTLAPQDAVIIATQGHGDRAALAAVLACRAGYKGMVCSRKKLASLSVGLGLADQARTAALADLHAPAGLHIGSIEPEEIALAVVAEIIAERRGMALVAAPKEGQKAWS